MRVAADAHAHLYECYDLRRAFRSALTNLQALAAEGARPEGGPALPVLCLTERRDCDVFRRLRDGAAGLGLEFAVAPVEGGVRVTWGAGEPGELWIVPGRQVATRERLEVLALATEAEVPDGISAAEAVARVRERQGVPVLPWAPGKWMFGRRRIVEGLLEGTSPKDLLIGDSSLRPAGWPEPGLMRAARRAGFRIVAGSDPLPFAGEERMLGRYGVAGDGAFDPRCPAASLRRWLNDPASAFRRVGTRSPLAQVLRRLAGNARAGRAA